MNEKTWTIEPTDAEWRVFFEAVGRHVADPLLKPEIEASPNSLAWAQAAGMGLDLAILFSECYENDGVTVAVRSVDAVRKANSIKSAFPWRDESES